MSTTTRTSHPEPKKPLTKRWWFWLIIAVVVIGLFGSLLDQGDSDSAEPTTTPADPATATSAQPAAAPTEEEAHTVEFGGQTWACLPVPEDIMARILEGDKWDGGAHATVEKSVMVEGVDNNLSLIHI